MVSYFQVPTAFNFNYPKKGERNLMVGELRVSIIYIPKSWLDAPCNPKRYDEGRINSPVKLTNFRFTYVNVSLVSKISSFGDK